MGQPLMLDNPALDMARARMIWSRFQTHELVISPPALGELYWTGYQSIRDKMTGSDWFLAEIATKRNTVLHAIHAIRSHSSVVVSLRTFRTTRTGAKRKFFPFMGASK